MANTPLKKQKATIQGVAVEQISLQGNWYTPVEERIKIAQHAETSAIRREGGGYHVVSVQIIQMGERWAYHCMVEYPVGSGIVTPGTDFIDVKDSAGIAKAETSAIGRALGLHGIASEGGVASAEEMHRVTRDATADSPTDASHAPTHAPARAGEKSAAAAQWQDDLGYNPLADLALMKRFKAVGADTVAKVEAALAKVKAKGEYSRTTIYAYLARVEEIRREQELLQADTSTDRADDSGDADEPGLYNLHDLPPGARAS